MPTPTTFQLAPYGIPSDETNDDTVTSVDGQVEVEVTIKLVGTVSAVQSDWATLAATSLSAQSATMSWA